MSCVRYREEVNLVHVSVFVCRRKKRKMKKKKRWSARWKLPPTPTPPSCSSKEMVTLPSGTLQLWFILFCMQHCCELTFLFLSRLPRQQHRQVPARLHQQGLRELRGGVSGRLLPLPTGTKTHFSVLAEQLWLLRTDNEPAERLSAALSDSVLLVPDRITSSTSRTSRLSSSAPWFPPADRPPSSTPSSPQSRWEGGRSDSSSTSTTRTAT